MLLDATNPIGNVETDVESKAETIGKALAKLGAVIETIGDTIATIVVETETVESEAGMIGFGSKLIVGGLTPIGVATCSVVEETLSIVFMAAIIYFQIVKAIWTPP